MLQNPGIAERGMIWMASIMSGLLEHYALHGEPSAVLMIKCNLCWDPLRLSPQGIAALENSSLHTFNSAISHLAMLVCCAAQEVEGSQKAKHPPVFLRKSVVCKN